MMMKDDELLALRLAPARLGEIVRAHRTALFGDASTSIAIESVGEHAAPMPAVIVRGGVARELDAWPEPAVLRAGDRVVLAIADGETARATFIAWLRRHAASPVADTSVAPVGAQAAGLHRLWCIAAARLVLPATMRVEARHDLIGIRLAQIAVGLGADALTGPIAADRVLPLAGVTRPTETTRAGLRSLVRQAGMRPAVAAAPLAPTPSSPEVMP